MELDLGGHPGLLRRPPRARCLLVLAHGAGAGMRHAFLEALAEALATRRVATLRWDLPFMAAGRARPDRPEVAEAAVQDAWRATTARFAAGPEALPLFAGGKSFGGRMTSRAHAAAPLAGLRGLVFVGFPLHAPDRPSVERAAHLADAAGPLLFLQGTRDALAPLPRLRPVIAGLGRRATLHVIAGADHGFDVLRRSGRTAADVHAELATTIAAWTARRCRMRACGPATPRATRRS